MVQITRVLNLLLNARLSQETLLAVPPSVRLLVTLTNSLTLAPDAELHFLALRYEDDGEICVVEGPIAEPRREDDEQVFRIDRKNILLRIPCM
jgi:hypothetical protein